MTKDEALDLALEALEGYCEHGAILRPLEVRDAIKQARSAPVQEPAWYHAECNDPDYSRFTQEKDEAFAIVSDKGGYVTELYAKAQRPWVGLTNEEIAQIYLVNTDKPLKADWLFARAIERKLKEKNT